MKAEGVKRFKPYPAYKDSGVEWLGEIPEHWEVKRVRDVAESIQTGPFGSQLHSDEYVMGGTPVINPANLRDGGLVPDPDCTVDSKTANRLAQHRLQGGDILFARRGDLGRCGLVTKQQEGWLCATGCLRLRPRTPRIQPRYLIRLLSTSGVAQWLALQSVGATMQNLNTSIIARIPVAEPSPSEQDTIAAFIDRETARIDALVAKKERLIELLQEKRAAIITHAVTKGLPSTGSGQATSNVPLKDSGVEWLGEIPAHWEVKRLWHLTPSDRRIMYGIVLPGPNVDDGVPIVKGGDVLPGRLRLDRLNRTTFEIESGYVRSRLQGGDLVFAIRGSIGEVAVVPDELTGANLTQDAARVAYTPAVHGPWLFHALRSRRVFAQLEAGALGATIRGINIRDLKRASIPVPPRGEQEVIAAVLDGEVASVDALVAKVRDAIDRLEELRTALISAAVAGKIDVRTEAA